jgi:hypothetical protein
MKIGGDRKKERYLVLMLYLSVLSEFTTKSMKIFDLKNKYNKSWSWVWWCMTSE